MTVCDLNSVDQLPFTFVFTLTSIASRERTVVVAAWDGPCKVSDGDYSCGCGPFKPFSLTKPLWLLQLAIGRGAVRGALVGSASGLLVSA
ncbi:uncharacterized protein FTOL_08395 [Fusarium torulosum]|uniref:Uncharacterized protein n=1 Tax=Fusarium torulosum TaxID=33205 RepID=A0AAE8SJY4_9HYPO|nr:uncharacterized protein FTOL_08395 [Fusarium torulosum]